MTLNVGNLPPRWRAMLSVTNLPTGAAGEVASENEPVGRTRCGAFRAKYWDDGAREF
ncbi:MAG: hypothetical protein KDB03_27145 [Planctomycetales bacterium]|nr:hypothetical protein [Planctomycetales bacterium]